MKFPKVCIIVLNWNGKELLKDCLSSLFKLTHYPNYKVIVVDNGSTDGSVEFVKKNFPKTDVLALDKNYGFSKGNNIGIKYALKKYKPKYILLLNNDTKIIQRDWLRKMVEAAESNEKIGIVGCKLIYPNGKLQHLFTQIFTRPYRFFILHYMRGKHFSIRSHIYSSSRLPTAACVLIKSNILKRIRGFDENYSPYWLEDTDLFINITRLGYLSLILSDVLVVHKEGTSFKKINPKITEDDFVFFIQRRNMFYFLLKNYGWLAFFSQFWIILLDAVFSFSYLKPRKNFFKKAFLVLSGIKASVEMCVYKRYKTNMNSCNNTFFRKVISHKS